MQGARNAQADVSFLHAVNQVQDNQLTAFYCWVCCMLSVSDAVACRGLGMWSLAVTVPYRRLWI